MAHAREAPALQCPGSIVPLPHVSHWLCPAGALGSAPAPLFIVQRHLQLFEQVPAPACNPPGSHLQKQMHLLNAYGKVPLSRAIRLAV